MQTSNTRGILGGKLHPLRKEYVLILFFCLLSHQYALMAIDSVTDTINWALKAPTNEKRNTILLNHVQTYFKQMSPQEAITLSQSATTYDTRDKILMFFAENNLQMEPGDAISIATNFSKSEHRNQLLELYSTTNHHRLSAKRIIDLASNTTNGESRNRILISYTESKSRGPITTDESVLLSQNASTYENRDKILKHHFYSNPKLPLADFNKLHDNCAISASKAELYDAMTERKNPINVYINSDHPGISEYINGIADTFHSSVIAQNINKFKMQLLKMNPSIANITAFGDLVRQSGAHDQWQQFEFEMMKSYWPSATTPGVSEAYIPKSISVQQWLELSKSGENTAPMVDALRQTYFYLHTPTYRMRLHPLFVWEDRSFWTQDPSDPNEKKEQIIFNTQTINLSRDQHVVNSNSVKLSQFGLIVENMENLTGEALLELSKRESNRITTRQILGIANSTSNPFHDQILDHFARKNAGRLGFNDMKELTQAASDVETKQSIIENIFLGNPELQNQTTAGQLIELAATVEKESSLHDKILLDYAKKNIKRLSLEDVLSLSKSTFSPISNGTIIEGFLKERPDLRYEELQKLAEVSRSELAKHQISDAIARIEQKADSLIRDHQGELTGLLTSLIADFPIDLIKRHLGNLKDRAFASYSNIDDLNKLRDFYEKLYKKGNEVDLLDQEILVRFSKEPRMEEYSRFSPSNTTLKSWFDFVKLAEQHPHLEALLWKVKPPFYVRRSGEIRPIIPIATQDSLVWAVDPSSNNSTQFPKKLMVLSLHTGELQSDSNYAKNIDSDREIDVTVSNLSPQYIRDRINLIRTYYTHNWSELRATPSYWDQRFSLKFETGFPMFKKKHNVPVILLSIDNKNPKKPKATVMLRDQFEGAATIRNEVDTFEVPLKFLNFASSGTPNNAPTSEISAEVLRKQHKKGSLLVSSESRRSMASGIASTDVHYQPLAKLLHERELLIAPPKASAPIPSPSNQGCIFAFQGIDI